MSNLYKIKVNDSYSFEFNQDNIESIDSIQKSINNFHILENNQSFDVQVIKSDFNRKKYTVQVNGNNYQVDISNELDLLINDLGLEASSSKKGNEIKAPMPGLIVSIDVKVGQEIAEGDSVLVLEAMKMENTLLSPRGGIIRSILIGTGDKVEKNELLIEME